MQSHVKGRKQRLLRAHVPGRATYRGTTLKIARRKPVLRPTAPLWTLLGSLRGDSNDLFVILAQLREHRKIFQCRGVAEGLVA
jgi:hypothetical protein